MKLTKKQQKEIADYVMFYKKKRLSEKSSDLPNEPLGSCVDNKTLKSRVTFPLKHRTFRFDNKYKNCEKQIAITYHWKRKSLLIECIE